ncbi:TfpX/TfpZ family type IV pilin accessory protein [Acinetobacter sp. YH12043]|uniref:TfpX/TfpZ family type IV pilin accessory protein n=1 Tax=Acinetobacter sp. YH12043 TaxID=2601050 RepID=UPI0015D10FD0|nr:TfpX/TfpZ family type IV pilin accessory protein [Acinetobacter sp. YH12043]
MSKRLKFFLGHLSISVIIALIVLYLIFYVWYPVPLHQALGITHLTFMLLAIDVVIGPLFGWLVYKEDKKSLKFDLAIVILLQVSAFAYGFYTIAKGRPAWIVYDSLAFHIVRHSDIETSHLHLAQPKYQQPSWFKPQVVALLDTKDIQKTHPIPKFTIAMDHPMYYTDLTNMKSKIENIAFSLNDLKRFNNPQKVQQVLNQYPMANSWLGLSGVEQDMVVLMNKETAEVIKIADLRPWK